MILLSRIIKSPLLTEHSGENRTIEIKPFIFFETFIEEEEVAISAQIDTTERDAMIQKANEEAVAIVQSAKAEAEYIQQKIVKEKENWLEVERRLLEEEAKQMGYDEGYAVGKEQGYDEIKEYIMSAQKVVSSSKKDYQQYLESAEKTILQLAVMIAEKIINMQMTLSEEAYFQLVKKAIKEAREYEHVELRVHPTQYDYVLAQKEELQGMFPKETQFFIFPDEELAEADCIIETASGRIDASINSQLQEMKMKLNELLEGE